MGKLRSLSLVHPRFAGFQEFSNFKTESLQLLILPILRVWTVLHHWAESRVVVSGLEGVQNNTSRTSLYLGSDGLVSKTPFMNQMTRGWFPNEPPSGGKIIMDRAFLAVFIALYDKTLANWSRRNYSPSAKDAERGLIFLELLNVRYLSW